ncbi:MAG: DUF899 domain-containing protein [Actinophytocola sp.]|uniref:DUF899 domain-containing protein n=1 Tax=Actinophytocola sp. TaxID=1872138 RepID=UPI003C72A097
MNLPRIVRHDEWLEARKELLVREKALTKARDELAAARRELPMVLVEKEYVFTGPDGPATLLDLFDGRKQLIVHHMMWAYDFDEDGNEVPRDTGCPSCSAHADNIPHLAHLHQRETSYVAVSRAPRSKIGPFLARMGWAFPWYSSHGSDFNHDFHVTEDERVAPVLLNYRTTDELAEQGFEWSPARRGDYPGMSAFLRDGDQVFHTYSTFARGLEQVGGTHYFLDMTALGRQEPWEKPEGRAAAFGAQAGSPDLRFHDEY